MFKDRFDAGYQLAARLKKYDKKADVIILAIPRGGLEVGSVLARELHAPLDVVLTKKIGFPGQPEYAIGAVSVSHVYLSPEFENDPYLKEYIAGETIRIRQLLEDRSKYYHENRNPVSIKNKIVIVVDDGVATGSTLLASLALIKQEKPKKIIVALPVSPAETLENIKQQVDEVVCLEVPIQFFGVGQVYHNFKQVADEEALRLLQEAQR